MPYLVEDGAMPYTLQQAARQLRTTAKTLAAQLRRAGVFDRTNRPQGRYSGQGYFIVQQKSFRHPIKGTDYYYQTLITEEGLEVVEKLITQNNRSRTLH